MPLPLEGIKIVDCTVYQNGPQATVMLADMGASVIKIEQPKYGDPHRFGISGANNQGQIDPYMEAHNRHKRSVTVDLRTEEGREIIYRLVRDADVFVQNFRVGVMEKWGLGFKDLAAHNPRLIYASNSGLGERGEERSKAVLDMVGQARGGLMLANRDVDGTPKYLGAGIADQVGAMWLAFGISMALHARDRFGITQSVETSQLGSVISLQGMSIDTYLMYGREPVVVSRFEVRNPLWNSYRDRDGNWFVLACLHPDKFWPAFCRILGLPELECDPRFDSLPARDQNSRVLVEILDRVFATRSREEWLAALTAEEIMSSVVSSYAEVAQDPQVQANEFITTIDHPTFGAVRIVGNPVHLSATPPNPHGYAPELGQHTEEVLLEHGYTWEDLTRFREAGAI